MEYVLDLSTWRCGMDMEVNPAIVTFNSSRGTGTTSLLNGEGFSCCLGQFAIQVGVPKEVLRDRNYPNSIGNFECMIPNEMVFNPAYDTNFVLRNPKTRLFENTPLASILAKINDGNDPVPIKIHRIRKELRSAGHTLKVIAS